MKNKLHALRLAVLTFLLWFIIPSNTQAQPQKYLFTYLGIKDGLLADNIFAVQQDDRGFMWIASNNALQRYDGQRFVNFYHDQADSTSLPRGGIRGMKLDKKNRLWLLSGTISVGYFDVHSFKYTAVKIKEAPGDDPHTANALYIDQDGNVILIVVGHGFVTYDEDTQMFSSKKNPFSIPAGWGPLYFWQDPMRNYWLGSHAGLLKYNPANKQMSYRDHNAEKDPIIDHFGYARTVVFAFVDRSGRFWVTSWPENKLHIRSYSPAQNKETEWNDVITRQMKGQYFEMQGITEFSDGSLWLAGTNILAKFDDPVANIEPVFSNASDEYSIRYDNIYYLQEDREKNIWVCTNKGLFWFNPSAQVFRSITNRTIDGSLSYTNDVTGLLETKDRQVLVSTWGAGAFAYDQQFRPIASPYVDRTASTGEGMLWCLEQLPNGDIWKGGQDGYFYIFQAASGKILKLHPPEFENSTVRQLKLDKYGNVWVGTNRGDLLKWEAATGKFTCLHRFKTIIGRIYLDEADEIWVCTDRKGIYKLSTHDGTVLAQYGDSGAPGKTLRINGAADIIRYNDSLFMIAADGLAMLNWRTGQIVYMPTPKSGLPVPHINNVIKDDDGYVWMTSPAGILSYHPLKGKSSRYNALDGIPNTSFSVAASLRLKDGRIVFGTNHDLIVFDPKKTTVSKYVPPVVQIAGLSVMNKALNVDSADRLKQISLQHFEHSVTFLLSTLTFQNTYDIYYRMEGLDKDWVPAGNQKQATFNYLRPGSYVFNAACRNADGSMGQITQMRLQIFAPFWKTGWFYSMVIFFLAALIFWADRLRLRQIHREQLIRSAIAANLHEEVNTTLQNINVLSEIAGFKADENPEQSKGFIYDIKQKSRNMVIAMGDVLWSIDPVNDDMNKTINRINEHIESFRSRYQSVIELRVDPTIKNTRLDMKMRHELMVIFKLALVNIVELLKSPHTVVQLDRAKKSLSLNIYSTQSADQKAAHLMSKNVLEMKKRAANINATLDVQSDEAGSYVLLIIKLV